MILLVLAEWSQDAAQEIAAIRGQTAYWEWVIPQWDLSEECKDRHGHALLGRR